MYLTVFMVSPSTLLTLVACWMTGAAIILGAVFVHPLLARPRRISQPELLGTAEAKGVAE